MGLLIGVVGNGSMGRRRIRHALAAGAEVVGWDLRADRRGEVEAMFGIATAATEADFLTRPLDALFVSVPPSDHEHYIFAAIERGIPFMVEQPISHQLENLDAIRAAVVAKGLVSHVSCNHRYSARIRAFADILGDGRVGKPLTGFVEIGEYLPDWHPYEPYTDYYPSWQRMGGGLDAICDLDWLIFLFGEVREARSMCSRKSELNIDTHDVVQLLVDFKDGPQLVLHCDMLQRTYHQQTRFVCSKGIIVDDFPTEKLRVYYADQGVWEEVAYMSAPEGTPAHIPEKAWQAFVEGMYEADSADFLGRLERGDASTASLDSGLYNLRVVKPLIFPDFQG